MAIIQKKNLRDISLDDENFLITGIIIGKSEPTIFLRNEQYHGVIQFTVRDHCEHFTNCKCWGTKQKIDDYNRLLHLNDLINIVCPRISVIQKNEDKSKNNQFQPKPTTPYTLVVHENSGYLEKPYFDSLAPNRKLEYLKSLINVPVKPLNSTMSLADINLSAASHENGNEDFFVDLLICVRRLRPVREIKIKMKNDQILKCLELVVIDKSLPSGMALTIWNKDWIHQATQYWQPLKTILHLIDVRVTYSTFYKSTVLGLSQKSLIFDRLKGAEIDALRNFVSSTELADDSMVLAGGFNLPSADTITTLMTVQQIYDRALGKIQNDADQFTAVLFATITKFDLDGFTNIFGRKCKSCSHRLIFNQLSCENEQCLLNFSFGHSGNRFDYYFDINLHLTDHTGTLIEARMSNQIAERILSVRIDEFMNMSDNEKTNLKWKFLLEKFKVKLLIKKKSSIRNNIGVILIDLNEQSLDEVVQKILVY